MKLLLKLAAVSSLAAGIAGLTGCAAPVGKPVAIVASTQKPAPADSPSTVQPPMTGGGYYRDDGPGENPPANLAALPDAEPKPEVLHRFANDPYRVLGVSYTPDLSGKPFKQQGLASWYGRKFHGKSTSSGEPYDMYAMTAAHKTLPIPSYVRVTNQLNSRSVVLRINDRGPFHDGRVIDLSYAAAYKLDILKGVTPVEVELLAPLAAPEQAPLAEPIRIYRVDADGQAITGQPLQAQASPAAAPATAEPVTPAIAAVDMSGIWLQLGAFGKPESARALLGKVQSGASGLSLRQVEMTGLHRVQVGPFATPAEAAAARQTLVDKFALKPYALRDGKPLALNPAANSGPLAKPVAAKPAAVVKKAATADKLTAHTEVSAIPAAPAEPVPVAVPAVAQAEAIPSVPGIYLQLGAVSKREAADVLVRKAGAQASLPGMHRFEAGNMIKVQVGPFANPAEADAAAVALEKTMGVKPFRVIY